MNNKNHRLIISFVSITILATIAVQVYWNYLNYQSNKEELINQVQVCLDQAVDNYYSDIAQGHSMTITETDSLERTSQIRHVIKHDKHNFSDTITEVNTFRLKTKVGDLVRDSIINIDQKDWNNITAIRVKDSGNLHFDEADLTSINLFASKILISMSEDQLDFDKLSTSIKNDFDQRNWPIAFGFVLRETYSDVGLTVNDTLKIFGDTNRKEQLMATSNSTFIPENTSLEIHFSNISSILWKRSVIGILLSLLLSGAVICCLLYLIKTINEQKQLAEIKNDLISNITHEFKTPITTIGTALEGIENFRGLENLEKTKKYIGISNSQLGKLNTMVEKLLETASIDSEHLNLKLEKINLTQLIAHQLNKYRQEHEGLSFQYVCSQDELFCLLDKFHIESAIGNLIDNAIKYGDGKITVLLEKIEGTVLIQVCNNGLRIAKDQRTKIFDKFYRIPTGNIHNVKGFGIGLYYAKNIIEKHGGKLELDPTSSKTTFNITLSHAN